MYECICVCTTSFTLFHMLSKTSTPSCTFFKTLSISPCNFLGAPIISKMSSVIGWVQQDKIRACSHTLASDPLAFIHIQGKLGWWWFHFASFFTCMTLGYIPYNTYLSKAKKTSTTILFSFESVLKEFFQNPIFYKEIQPRYNMFLTQKWDMYVKTISQTTM
jgi:hypothetical protein